MSKEQNRDDKYELYDGEVKFRYFNDEIRTGIAFDHQHSKFEVYFSPTAVPGSLTVNSTAVSWDRPCVLIVYPYMLHSSIRTDSKVHERYYFSFSKKMLDHFDARIVPKVLTEQNSCCLFALNEETVQELRRIIDPVIERRDTASVQERELAFMMFITRLCELCDEGEVYKLDTMLSYIFDVTKYILENFKEPLTSTDIARHFSISRSKLERNFKASTGCSVHGFIDVCRMNEALNLLVSPSFTSVKRVSELCGFENETYFYLFFKRRTQMSPLEYRRMKLEGKTPPALQKNTQYFN